MSLRNLVTLRNLRLLQLFGIFLAVVGLAGFWFSRDVQRTTLSPGQEQLIGGAGAADVTPINLVVAGRDYDHTAVASPCEWRDGRCYRERAGEFTLGNRTDTIIFMSIIGSKVYMINIPRDIYLPEWQTRINTMYGYEGAAGLMGEVEKILGLPIDYYAIVNIDIFKELVDDIGGVDIVIPYDMRYVDRAAGLVIDFDEGPAHLNGEDAAKFVRYRETALGDFDRIDNVKRLAYAMLERLKELNVRAVGRAPALIDTYFDEVETNVSSGLIYRLVPRLGSIEIQEAATLPVCCEQVVPGQGEVLGVDPLAVETFIAATFGGRERELATVPEEQLLITNRSGIPGLAARVKERLVALGVAEELLSTREAPTDPGGTRLVATSDAWGEADYYTGLLHVSKQQVARFTALDDRRVHLELILGGDAGSMVLAGVPAGGGN